MTGGSHYNTKLVDSSGTRRHVDDCVRFVWAFSQSSERARARDYFEPNMSNSFKRNSSERTLWRLKSEAGHLIAIASGALLHEAYPRNLLCDAMGDPYPDINRRINRAKLRRVCHPLMRAWRRSSFKRSRTGNSRQRTYRSVDGRRRVHPWFKTTCTTSPDDDALDEPGDDDDDFIEPSDESGRDYDGEHERA